ncbi:MAG: hypothetical protein JST52_11540, partial [Bacteroidetes bacterium]|nr:hypothetical protein [Bacteroidota bacterium]
SRQRAAAGAEVGRAAMKEADFFVMKENHKECVLRRGGGNGCAPAAHNHCKRYCLKK